ADIDKNDWKLSDETNEMIWDKIDDIYRQRKMYMTWVQIGTTIGFSHNVRLKFLKDKRNIARLRDRYEDADTFLLDDVRPTVLELCDRVAEVYELRKANVPFDTMVKELQLPRSSIVTFVNTHPVYANYVASQEGERDA
ncbi:hypothetical protein LGW19_10110, partial [Streptococcus mutans]|nr:hypothetical protein [Streptococcus mutans]